MINCWDDISKGVGALGDEIISLDTVSSL